MICDYMKKRRITSTPVPLRHSERKVWRGEKIFIPKFPLTIFAGEVAGV